MLTESVFRCRNFERVARPGAAPARAQPNMSGPTMRSLLSTGGRVGRVGLRSSTHGLPAARDRVRCRRDFKSHRKRQRRVARKRTPRSPVPGQFPSSMRRAEKRDHVMSQREARSDVDRCAWPAPPAVAWSDFRSAYQRGGGARSNDRSRRFVPQRGPLAAVRYNQVPKDRDLRQATRRRCGDRCTPPFHADIRSRR